MKWMQTAQINYEIIFECRNHSCSIYCMYNWQICITVIIFYL